MLTRNLFALLAVGLSIPVSGQGVSVAAPPSPDPTRADAPQGPLAYRSPFEGYRPHRDITPGPWRAMNDEVARIGGWKAYAREAHEAATTKAPSEGRAAPAAPATAAPKTP